MEQKTRIGMNRTGLKTAAEPDQEAVRDLQAVEAASGNGERIDATRVDYAVEAEPLGTVPVPATAKGMAKAAVQALAGRRPEVLIDRIGERLAFERSGTRLYDALLSKAKADPAAVPDATLERLAEFREEEARHFNLLADALQRLGADPTAETPGADASGVASLGLLQAVADPRTTLPQALEAVLIAELADHAGWELLITLAREFGQDELADEFTIALREEEEHLATVKRWLVEAVRRDAA